MSTQYPTEPEQIGDGRTPEKVAVLSRLAALELRMSEAAWRVQRSAEECEEIEALFNTRGLPDDLATGPAWERVGRAASRLQIQWERWQQSVRRVIEHQKAVVKGLERQLRDARG